MKIGKNLIKYDTNDIAMFHVYEYTFFAMEWFEIYSYF